MTDSIKVFVYGTLKRDGCRANMLADSKYLGEASTLHNYTMVDLGHFPGIIFTPIGGTEIHGELFEVDSKTLAVLDRVEGHPDFYQRLAIPTLQHGNRITAYTYELSTDYLDSAKVITSGTWRN